MRGCSHARHAERAAAARASSDLRYKYSRRKRAVRRSMAREGARDWDRAAPKKAARALAAGPARACAMTQGASTTDVSRRSDAAARSKRRRLDRAYTSRPRPPRLPASGAAQRPRRVPRVCAARCPPHRAASGVGRSSLASERVPPRFLQRERRWCARGAAAHSRICGTAPCPTPPPRQRTRVGAAAALQAPRAPCRHASPSHE